ncbi:MAG: indole-3-glycerol phosphate synthase TrpC [Desulfocucumaceae bacterium]
MILQAIIANKYIEVKEFKQSFSREAALTLIEAAPAAKSLSKALNVKGKVALLAEIKRASPSKGVIRENLDPSEIARIYSENGASAISVLTDRKFFSGLPEYIPQVRKITELPILRKDFIIDPVQIYEARLLGADAVLLICSVLSQEDLTIFMKIAASLGMETLVEVHDEYELSRALEAGAQVIGINNRDLKTFDTDINTTLKLCKKLGGATVTVVSESGIKSRRDIELLKEAGVSAVLVGEALMASENIAARVRELSGYKA